MFECLTKDDLERRINGSLRLPAFEKGNDSSTKVQPTIHSHSTTAQSNSPDGNGLLSSPS
ncbi:hypothetical protein [Segetibacter sp.]|uniref:hypothetical protein n=1 Tax=Segetibacter sp. TaxID=2231182 RepID=UPI00262550EF|nr:hypothetical protein [Segetibacter sp.]